MPSKKSKKTTKKKKSAAAIRRGEELAVYLKRGTYAMLGVALIASLVLGVKMIARHFNVDRIVVSGNYHLDEEDVVKSMKIKKGYPLLDIRSADIKSRLAENPWIKSVALKKQFPGTLLIKIEEAEPSALLSLKKKLYIIDENGNILERIKGGSTPFLPVIKGIGPDSKKEITEALKLISVLSANNVLSSRESVEIGAETYGLFMNMDGELIKVGYGSYQEKFERWMELEPEIRKRGLPIKYVDLRFKDSVIVKPAKKLKKGKSS